MIAQLALLQQSGADVLMLRSSDVGKLKSRELSKLHDGTVEGL